MVKKRDFLSISDLTSQEIWEVLLMSKTIKSQKEQISHFLKEKQVVLLFEKPSLRTKLSFVIGINKLGGDAIYFGQSEVGLGQRESVADVAKVISSQADLIIGRVFSHKQLEELAKNSSVPVINALSDLEHPCQILADFLTILEIKGQLSELHLAFVGDGENNVPHSLALGCNLLGVNFSVAAPKGYWMKKQITNKLTVLETDNPKKAIKGADVVYTDTWISMGDEKEQEKRLKIFKPFQVNQKLMSLAKSDAIFMHDLPAYRGNEVSKQVIDGEQSVIFQQAENRLYVQMALMLFLLGFRIDNLTKGSKDFSIFKHHLPS